MNYKVQDHIKPKALTGKQFKAHSIKGAQIDQATLTGVSAASLAGVQYAMRAPPGRRPARVGLSLGTRCPR